MTALADDPLYAALLVAIGLGAGFVNTLAGGGSLVMVPALMLSGLPADAANATSRLSVVAQCATGTISYARAGLLASRALVDVVPATLVGALGGAWVATVLPNRVFEPLLIGTMVAMALALFARPEALVPPPGSEPRRAGRRPLSLLALLAVGFYGGLLQAGVGFVLLAVLGGMLRYDLLRGNALKVAIVLCYSLVALAVFVARGLVEWVPGVALAAGSAVGARLAVKFAVALGERAVKQVVLAMVVVMCAVLILR